MRFSRAARSESRASARSQRCCGLRMSVRGRRPSRRRQERRSRGRQGAPFCKHILRLLLVCALIPPAADSWLVFGPAVGQRAGLEWVRSCVLLPIVALQQQHALTNTRVPMPTQVPRAKDYIPIFSRTAADTSVHTQARTYASVCISISVCITSASVRPQRFIRVC